MKRRPSSTRATSFKAGGIDLHQAVCGLDRSSYPVAQRQVLGQHFFSTLKRELGPVDALPGIGNFRCQNVGHRPVALGFQSVHGFLTHGGRYRSLVSDKCTSACFAGRCRLRCDRQRPPAEEPDVSPVNPVDHRSSADISAPLPGQPPRLPLCVWSCLRCRADAEIGVADQLVRGQVSSGA